jgi:hypothetical protein
MPPPFMESPLDFVTVSRSLWHRGKEAAEKDAYLYNLDTLKYDVIGLILHDRCGVNRQDLHKVRLPSVVAHHYCSRNRTFSRPYEWLVNASHTDTEDTFELIKLNDDANLKDDEREEKITSFLAKRGISIKFV